MKGSETMGAIELPEEFTEAFGRENSAPPDGWRTINEIAEGMGVNRVTADRRLKKMEKEGKIESGMFLVDAHRKRYYNVDGVKKQEEE